MEPAALALAPYLAPQAALAAGLFSALAAAMATGFAARIARRRATSVASTPLYGEGISFLFSGRSLWMATDEARKLLEQETASSDQEALLQFLARRGADLRAKFDRLINLGAPFKVEAQLEDGNIWMVEGQPRGAMAGVVIRDITQSEARVRELTQTLDQLSSERERYGMVLSTAPFAACHLGTDNDVTWANDAYKRLAATDPANDAAFKQAISAAGSAGTARLSLHGGERTVWFDILTRPAPEGGTLAFALPADKVVATEDALHRFVSTLTETFAHLSVGLAVFDSDRRLHIFNPALSDLTGIKPSWLATQPSLTEVFDRLRERRIMPVQPNFEQFRANVARIEAGATAGDLSETWIQPTGRTFRISGRPHPKNSVAIMVEDISDSVTLERQYRSEIKLGQSALDCVSDAVAIFDPAGRMTFANRAFAQLWELPEDWQKSGMTVQTLTTHCDTRTGASPVWTHLRESSTAAGERSGWQDDVTLLRGEKRQSAIARVEPMPNGSTLVVFALQAQLQTSSQSVPDAAKSAPGRGRRDWATEIFREALLEAADRLGATSQLADGMRIAVRQGDAAREMEARSAGVSPEAAVTLLHEQLTSLVLDRGHSIDLEIDSSLDAAALPVSARHGMLGLLLAVKSLSEPRTRLSMALTALPDGTQITVSTSAASGLTAAETPPDTLPLRILARLSGGKANVSAFALDDGGAGLTLQVPNSPLTGIPPRLAIGS